MSDAGSGDREQQGIQALETGLTVLEAFMSSSVPLRLSEVASLAHMHPAKVHRYLVSFVRKNYVVQDANGRYQLGPAALRIGLSSLKRIDHLPFVAEALDFLANEMNESVFAAGWGVEGPILLHWRAPRRTVAVNLQIGTVLPLLSSATGQVFTTYISSSLIHETLKRPVHAMSLPDQEDELENFIASIKQSVRAKGVGMVEGEYVAGLNSISAPVFNHQGQIVVALTAVGMEQTFGREQMLEGSDALRRTAAEVSAQLGFGGLTDAPFKETSEWG